MAPHRLPPPASWGHPVLPKAPGNQALIQGRTPDPRLRPAGFAAPKALLKRVAFAFQCCVAANKIVKKPGQTSFLTDSRMNTGG